MANETTAHSTGAEPFDFDDLHQRSIYERLKRLVGPGAAENYKDACRLMVTEPAFSATTNLVSHLLREIESALRDVLISITEYKDAKNICEKCKQPMRGSSHKNKIGIILEALGFQENDPLAKAWLNLPGDEGLQKFAHRSGLGAVRRPDENFKELWAKIESIFGGILDRFETRYVKVLEKLNELAQKEDPTNEDVNFLASNIPNNLISFSHFFKQLGNPKWLPLLKGKRVITELPTPLYSNENGQSMVSYPEWPAATYLIKMAAVEPDLVTETLSELASTENANVKNNLLMIAVKLPVKNRLQLIEKIKDWIIAKHQDFVFLAGCNAIKSFAEEGQIDSALELSRIFLGFTMSPEREIFVGDGEVIKPLPEPRSRLNQWHYAEFMRKVLPSLLQNDAVKTLTMLSDLLCDFLELTYKNRPDHNFEDLLSISVQTFEEDSGGFGYEDVDAVLVLAIRDAAVRVVNNPAKLKIVLAGFEARKWTVFRRLNMYILSRFLEFEPEDVAKYLTDEIILGDQNFQPEYSQLAKKGFKYLSSDKKNKVLNLIAEAKSIRELIADTKEKIDDLTARQIIERWQRDKLSYFEGSLPPEWQTRFNNLLTKHGQPDHPDRPYQVTSFTGPTSDLHADDLLKMDIPTLILTLNTWEPKSDSHGFGPTKEGMGRELAVAVKKEPERFNETAEQFQGLDATYVRSYLQAFDELVRNKKNIQWEPILNLCDWVVKQPREIPERKGGVIDQDPHWGWTRRTVASLISTAVNQNLIPYEFREKIWSILEPLTTDPSPTAEDEKKRDGDLIDDPYGLAINTARGEAIGAVVEYALWVYRNLQKTDEGKESLKQGFGVMSEVRQVLEYHLNPQNDPSIAIRSVYGRFFFWILLIDRDWTLAHIDALFPAGDFNNPLYTAAWNSYLLHTQAFKEPMRALTVQYKQALKHLGEVKQSSRTDRDKRLVQQLMVFYWGGILTDADELIMSFWSSAPAEFRSEALEFVGRSLRSEKEQLQPAVHDRLKSLWEQRLIIAESAANKLEFAEEMSAFGWWFASDKFDPVWSCEQYLRALEIGTKTQSDYFVAERLVEIVKILPIQAVRILAKLIQNEEPRWFVFGNKDEIIQVLSTALNSSDSTAQQEAQDIINRLVSKGHTEYGDLLQSN